MQPEDQLEDVLAQRVPAEPDNIAQATRLTAAIVVQKMQQMDLPAAFAARLEQQIQQYAQTLAHAEIRYDWRNILLLKVRSLPRIATAVASLLTILMLIGGILASTAAQSLPGDWLYGVKQWENQVALSQAHTPSARVQIALSQLHTDLSDLQTEIRDHRSDANIDQALSAVAVATRQTQSAITSLPGDVAQKILTQALREERATLRQLLPQVDWPNQVTFTAQLGTVGDTVPQITQVAISTPGAGSVSLAIQGQHFLAGVQVVMDGRTIGTPQVMTTTQLAMLLPAERWGMQDHRVGIHNPDDTSVEVQLANESPGQGAQPVHPTPMPEVTPAHGRGHHSTPMPEATPIHGKEHHSAPVPAATPIHGKEHHGGDASHPNSG